MSLIAYVSIRDCWRRTFVSCLRKIWCMPCHAEHNDTSEVNGQPPKTSTFTGNTVAVAKQSTRPALRRCESAEPARSQLPTQPSEELRHPARSLQARRPVRLGKICSHTRSMWGSEPRSVGMSSDDQKCLRSLEKEVSFVYDRTSVTTS